MYKALFTTIIVCQVLTSCGQKIPINKISGITIDTGIKSEVEKHLQDSNEFDAFKQKMLVYDNSVFIQSYENDSLIFSSNDGKIKRPFKSFYYWEDDTLKIDGAFGLFTGIGFVVKIDKNNKVSIHHLLSSDEVPGYAYTKNDNLVSRLEVPCVETKVILSEIPDSNKKQIIFGYVEFKSGTYYETNGTTNGKEDVPRKKCRDNMKMYFKSSKLNL